ncbi:MAG TPA: hypothetical protein VEL76_43355 [Gemmataceae bacterium]|nr:hypothetical protein [Gemmataceae bacterium]
MAVTAPEWLTKRGGSLQPHSDGRTWYFMLRGQPQYKLVPVPVGGKFGCAISQTINGQRVESSSTATSLEDALRAGLEDLRKALGW